MLSTPEREAFSPASLFLHPERLKKALAIIEGNESTKISPICVEINPTDKCNKKCNWCFTRINRNSNKLKEQQFTDIITALYRAGTNCFHFSGGGEPTLHKGMYLLQSLKKNNPNIVFGLISNGVSIPEDLSELLLNYVDWIRISLTSNTSTENPELTINSQLQILKRANEHIISNDIKIGVSYMADGTIKNIQADLINILKSCNKQNISYLQIKTPYQSQIDFRQLALSVNKTCSNINNIPIHLFYPLSGAEGFSNCYYGLFSTVIGADGNVYPCCFSCGNSSMNFGPIEKYLDSKMIDSEYWDKLKSIDIRNCEYCRHVHFNKIIEALVKIGTQESFKIIDRITSGKINSKYMSTLRDIFNDINDIFFSEVEFFASLKKEAKYNKSLLFPVYREYEYLKSST